MSNANLSPTRPPMPGVALRATQCMSGRAKEASSARLTLDSDAINGKRNAWFKGVIQSQVVQPCKFGFDQAIAETQGRQRDAGGDHLMASRLADRIDQLNFLKDFLNTHSNLRIQSVFGWGVKCSGAAPKENVSQYDTFCICDTDQNTVIPLQLGSSFQIQIERLGGAAASISPIPVSDRTPKEYVALSTIGKVFSFQASSGLDPRVFWYRPLESSAMSQIAPPLLAATELEVGAAPITGSKRLGIDQLAGNICAYQRSASEPVQTQWMGKLAGELNASATRRMFEDPHIFRFGTIRSDKGRVDIDVDFQKDGLPLAEYFAKRSITSQELKWNVFFRAEDWPLKVFMTLLNAAGGYPFLKFNSKDSAEDNDLLRHIYLQPEVAQQILNRLQKINVNATAYKTLLSIREAILKRMEAGESLTSDAEQKENAQILKLRRQLLSNTDKEVTFGEIYQVSLEVPNEIPSKLSNQVLFQILQEEFKKAGNAQEQLTSFLYQCRTWQKISDRLGICCPTCAGKAHGAGEACPLPPHKTPSPHQIKTVTVAVPKETAPAQRIHLKGDFNQDKTDILTALEPIVIQLLQKPVPIPENSCLLQQKAHEAIQEYSAALTVYREHEPMKYAMLTDYILSLVTVTSEYAREGQLKEEAEKLLYLVKAIIEKLETIPIPPNAPYRFELGQAVIRAVKVLLNHGIIAQKDYAAALRQFRPQFDLENEAEQEFAEKFEVKSSTAKETLPAIDSPFGEQLVSVLPPVQVVYFTGFLGAGKTQYLKEWIKEVVSEAATSPSASPKRYGVKMGEKPREEIHMIVNDAAGKFDADILGTHSSAKENEMLIIAKSRVFNDMEKNFRLEKVEQTNDTTHAKENMVALEGCICCKDQDFLIQALQDKNDERAGSGQSKVIIVEATGIADLQGILNVFKPFGRVLHSYGFVVIDPSDAHWAELYEKLITGRQSGKDLDPILSVYWNQLALASHYVINPRGDKSEEQGRIQKIKQLIQKRRQGEPQGENYQIIEKNLRGDSNRDAEFALQRGINRQKVEADGGQSEMKAADLRAQYVRVPNDQAGQLLKKLAKEMLSDGEETIVRVKGAVKIGQQKYELHVTGGKLFLEAEGRTYQVNTVESNVVQAIDTVSSEALRIPIV